LPLEITDANFESEILSASAPALIDFSATWCGPCKMLAPTIDQLSGEFEGRAIIAKIDIDQAPETAQKFGIMSVPTVVYIKDGEEVGRDSGVQPKDVYTQKLESLL